MENKDVLAQMYGEKPAKKVRKHFTEIPVLEWEWDNFLQYWDSRYLETLEVFPPGIGWKAKGKYKAVIDSATKHWGKELFKEMIDFVFDNLAYYPQWTNPTINLVCGSHYWVAEISRKVQQKGQIL